MPTIRCPRDGREAVLSETPPQSPADPSPLPQLPAHILRLLADLGVHDLHGWRQLGPKRLRQFGITKRTVDLLDRAAKVTIGSRKS